MTLPELHDFVRPLAAAEFHRIFAAKGFEAADVARCPRESTEANWKAAKAIAWKAADRVTAEAYKAAGFPIFDTTLCHQSGGERSDRPF